MRMIENLECYIDGFDTVHVYMKKTFYQGTSQTFHLKDEHGSIIPLSITDQSDLGSHFRYECSIDAPLEMGKSYTLYDEHCRTAPACYSHIVKTSQFADQFVDETSQYGCFYTPEETTFRLWSPVAAWARVVLLGEDGEEIIDMDRDEKGNWTAKVDGDLLHVPYIYRLKIKGKINETHDPYNLFTGINTSCSQVNDISLLDLPEKAALEPMKQQTDAIIYECSVRDLTAQNGTGVTHPKTFEAFTEENETTKTKRTGFSYLKELGVTHIQLMPVLDFGSVDEEYPTLYYNWGYDPASYMALEGSYSTDPADPPKRIAEFAKLVRDLHEAGLKVTLDLVFNHVWSKDTFGLENLVPDYYFLMDAYGNYSNGSWCGNDIDSRPKMSQRYLIDAAMQLIDVFDVDGFRFDLMGILDTELINEIARQAKERKEDFMIYGEGWDMPSYVPSELRASQNNQAKMPLVGHFSDRFRELIRGNSGQLDQPGYPAGNFSLLDDVKQVMCASVLEGRYDAPFKAVNYVECHDNHTMWDKNRRACSGALRSERMKRQSLINAMVLLAQGVPFIHCGQEFGRTKQNLGNTYNRSDNYNMIDYHRRDIMEPLVDQFKQLVEIRKNHSSLRLDTVDKIRSQVRTSDLEGKVLVYETWDENDHLIMFFNPSYESFSYNLPAEGTVLFDSERANEEKTRCAVIAPISTVVVELPVE